MSNPVKPKKDDNEKFADWLYERIFAAEIEGNEKNKEILAHRLQHERSSFEKDLRGIIKDEIVYYGYDLGNQKDQTLLNFQYDEIVKYLFQKFETITK